MPKKNPWAKWTLPEVVHPETNRCFTVWIPNEQHYIAAFHGAMLDLASAKKWADDEAHTAVEVAAVMMTAFRSMEACEVFDVRQNSGAPCTLEKTTDGAIWTAWANLQLCPPKIRVSNGVLQWWDGAEWIGLPGYSDERTDGTYTPPWPPGSVPPGQTAQCLSAENIVSVYSTTLTQMRAAVALMKPPTAVAAIGVGILSIFMPVAIIGEIMLVLCGILEELGTAGIDDMLDNVTLRKLKCLLETNASSDGSFTAEGYNAFYSGLSGAFSGLKLAALQYYFDCLGPVGLSRQGKADNISVGDCGCFDWCYTFYLDTSSEGWYISDGNGTPADGGQFTGSGLQTTFPGNPPPNSYRYARMQIDFTATSIADILFTHTTAYGTDAGGLGWTLWPNAIGGGGAIPMGNPTGPTSYLDLLGGVISTIVLNVTVGNSGAAGVDPGGETAVTQVRIRGYGTNPFGTSNC